MSRRSAESPRLRRVDIVRAVAVMAVLVLVVMVGTLLERSGGEEWSYPTPVAAAPAEEPIASEANMFRVRAGALAVAPDFAGDRPAHARSLGIYRRLREYPGAPPRIPHGLTDEEYGRTSCNVCHRRGGWVARFGTFAPVTPHPEYGACLQCHVPRDELVGTPLPGANATVVCSQCHVDLDRPQELFVAIDWRAAAWPETELQSMPGSPHRIPHEVRSRGNCLACHSGPGAVAELRMDHPERVNCRQCHVPAVSEDGFSNDPPDAFGRQGGDSP